MTISTFNQIDLSKVVRVLRMHGTNKDQRYILERVELKDGSIFDRYFVLTLSGWEETIFKDEDKMIGLRIDLENPTAQNQLAILNLETHEVLNHLDQMEPYIFANTLNLIIRSADKEKWEDEEKRLKTLKTTQDDLDILLSSHSNKKVITLQNVRVFIDQLHDEESSNLGKKFFKGIEYETEFGVSRLMADRVYHLPKLLEKLELTSDRTNSYRLGAKEDTRAGLVGLDYFFEASNEEEAQKIAEIFKKKITGIGERLLLASWDFANDARSWIFEVDTCDLYRKCYPDRIAHPNGEERREFLNLIRLLERTKFSLVRKPNKKSSATTTYELPVLQICSFDGCINLNGGWPRRLKLQVLPPSAISDKMSFVGAPIHRSTLRLDHTDINLATMLQTRRSQRRGEDNIRFSLKDLIIVAGLQNTAKKKPAQAIKLLIAKLNRLKEEGIIKSFPNQMPDRLQDPIIIKFPSRNTGKLD